MNNMRSKIKYIEKKIEYLVKYRYWICIVLGLLLICVQFRYNEYLAYKKYNNMHGIIIDNYVLENTHLAHFQQLNLMMELLEL